jgi:ornithine cyclodeaminase
MRANLHVITASTVSDILNKNTESLYQIIKDCYVMHDEGGCLIAPSGFLFFPHRPEARIIGLSAAIKPNQKKFKEMSGMKWIASYPKNILNNLPRASAVIILNHPETGFPIACIEGSLISATRTALSAVAGAEYLYNREKYCKSLGIIGTGFIAKNILKYLILLQWGLEEIHLYDTLPSSSKSFYEYAKSLNDNLKIFIHDSQDKVIQSSDLIIFATTERTPNIKDLDLFSHNPCVLHISLRDIASNVILNSINVVDDVEHILAAKTSVHLAYEDNNQDSSFIFASIGQMITGIRTLPSGRRHSIIYSPMGLGILDIAVSQFVYQQSVQSSTFIDIENFISIENEKNSVEV